MRCFGKVLCLSAFVLALSGVATADCPAAQGSGYPAEPIMTGPSVQPSGSPLILGLTLMNYRAYEGGGGAIYTNWTTGNAGNTWEEGEWIPYQIILDDLEPGLAGLDSIAVSFDFNHDVGGSCRFIDLVRGIQVGSAALDDLHGWPRTDGTPFATTTRSEIEIAQNHDHENEWIGFTMLNLPNAQVNRLLDGSPDVPPGADRHIFKIYKADLLAAGVDIDAATVVIYFQVHESRTFVWMNQLQSGYDAPPAADWGGYLYGTDGWPEAGPAYGSGYVPGSSGYVSCDLDGYARAVPIPIPEMPPGLVSGMKWYDADGDGFRQTGEAGISDWVIHISADLEQIDFTASLPTDASGSYSFANLTWPVVWVLKEDAGLDAFPGSTYVQTFPEVGAVHGAGVAVPVGPPPEGVAATGWEVMLSPDTAAQDGLDFGNVLSVSGIASESPETWLGCPSPNPFAGATLIDYGMPEPSKVTIGVYTVQGRLVRTLVEGVIRPGRHSAAWDGRDDSGRRLPPGVYILRMAVGRLDSGHKVVLLD